MKQVRTFLTLPVADKWLFAEALLYVFAAKIVLLFVPLSRCVALVTNEQSNAVKPSVDQLKQVKKAMHRTRWFMFWKNQCLVMSVASRWMLQRRRIPSVLLLGVTFDKEKNLIAHAWLTSNDFHVIEKDGDYHELYYF